MKNRGDNRREGFTLIELMVVLAIMGILVTLVTSISHYVLTKARERQTFQIQAIVLQAIQAYRDEAGDYPPHGDPPGNPPAATCSVLVRYLTGNLPVPNPPHGAVRAAGDVLAKLSRDAWSGGVDEPFRDGWGVPMQYVRDGGLGGTPLLISAGPDRRFAPPDSDTTDNVRSDDAK